MTTYDLTIVLGTGSGTTTPAIGTHTIGAGPNVVTATADSGYAFQNFVSYSITNPVPIVSSDNPHSFDVESETTVIVNFVEQIGGYDFGYLGTTSADGDRVKDRCTITILPDGTYDMEFGPNGHANSPLELACQEASQMVSGILAYYDETFVWGASPAPTITEPLKVIIADLAASVFKRRWMPDEATTRGPFVQGGDRSGTLDAQGWYGRAMAALKQYIRSTYIRPAFHLWNDDGSTSSGGIGGYKEE